MRTGPVGNAAELFALVAVALAAAGSGCAEEAPPGAPPVAAQEAATDYRAALDECLRTRHFEHCIDQAYREQAPPCDPTLEPIPLVRFDPPRAGPADRDVAGWVELEASVGPAGAPERPRVVGAEPPGVFDATALRSFSRWRYCAKAHQGKLVRTRLEFGASP